MKRNILVLFLIIASVSLYAEEEWSDWQEFQWASGENNLNGVVFSIRFKPTNDGGTRYQVMVENLTGNRLWSDYNKITFNDDETRGGEGVTLKPYQTYKFVSGYVDFAIQKWQVDECSVYEP